MTLDDSYRGDCEFDFLLSSSFSIQIHNQFSVFAVNRGPFLDISLNRMLKAHCSRVTRLWTQSGTHVDLGNSVKFEVRIVSRETSDNVKFEVRIVSRETMMTLTFLAKMQN